MIASLLNKDLPNYENVQILSVYLIEIIPINEIHNKYNYKEINELDNLKLVISGLYLPTTDNKIINKNF